jgi:hypothetical protein
MTMSSTSPPFKNDDRAPLLIVGGGSDHIVPPGTGRTNYYTVGQDGWEEVADYALDWASSHAGTPAAVGA